MTSPLFNFRLRDLDKVEPWTQSDGTKTLSWFGFSDGWYWMNCGSNELFRATPEMLVRWETPPNCCYCDYQVSRLWEDVLQILPKVLEQVPADVASILADEGANSSWCSNYRVWSESGRDPDEIKDEGIDWFGERYLDSLYLAQGPEIVLWRTEDTIHIRWSNADKIIEGTPVWTASRGTHHMPVEDFLCEVESFHNRFMSEMKLRVQAIAANWNRSDVQIVTRRLVEEQVEREKALSDALSVPHTTDWESVREATRIMGGNQ